MAPGGDLSSAASPGTDAVVFLHLLEELSPRALDLVGIKSSWGATGC